VSRSVGVKGAPAPEPLDVVVSPPPGAIWFDAESIEHLGCSCHSLPKVGPRNTREYR
jgi:hypothetical protein